MKDVLRIILIAGAFISYIIGAGTATGQEILQFFASFGYLGIGAILIAMILHAWFGAYLLGTGQKLQAESSGDIFRYFCGKYLGTFFDWFSQMFILIVFVVMISGAGATLTEYYDVNIYVGRFVISLLVLITVLLGLNRMVKILGAIGPLIILLVVLIGGTSFFTNLAGFAQAGQILEEINVPKATNSWWLSGFIYSSFVVLVATPFLIKLGKSEPKRKNVIWGGILGGILILVAVLAIYLGILSNIEVAYVKDIPTLFLADQIHPMFGVLFSIVLLVSIYSTAAPMLWTVTNYFAKDNVKKFRLVAIGVTVLGFFGGLLPFGQIIGTVYPYVGYMGMLLFAGMFYRQFINKGSIHLSSTKQRN
ncbi:hypothetical protein ACFSFY_12315 [Sporosarcina siberiensis]|uniref:Membrane protein YkvI n=1 Tax=Sporosarcina siberiensis TaxID=1365606 RepID=A0ABW4SH07_9BACL